LESFVIAKTGQLFPVANGSLGLMVKVAVVKPCIDLDASDYDEVARSIVFLFGLEMHICRQDVSVVLEHAASFHTCSWN